MKRIAVALVVAASMIVAAVAFGAQVNTYSVTAKTSPTKAGSKKKPVPVSLTFNYKVGEKSNQRPAGVNEYKIGFAGIRSDNSVAPKCSYAQIQQQQGDAKCPAGSLVGSGTITNTVGLTADPTSKAATCTLNLRLRNQAGGMVLVLQSPAGTTCAGVAVNDSIDGKFKNASSPNGLGVLSFKVPSRLLHPGAPTISVAVTDVTSKINLVKKGKKAFFTSVGGCKAGKRAVQVVFVQEDGNSETAKSTAPCKA